MKALFHGEATGIGSSWLADAPNACATIFEAFPHIPFWPQLPRRSFRENMYVQFSEGLPGVVVDDLAQTIHINTERALAEFETVYEKFLADDVEFFGVSPAYAAGLYEFVAQVPLCAMPPAYLKGHLTGPVSYALFLTDEHKRSIIYNKDLAETLTKVLAMKARWQARMLKRVHQKIIIFIDEPYLVSIGSSFVNIDPRAAVTVIDEVAAAIHDEGALVGLHCCGNTDWSLILQRSIDIVSFDSYQFGREFLLYADDIRSFINRGGTIAWGIVPSSDAIDRETSATLLTRLDDQMKALATKGVTHPVSMLVTPSCGVGSLDDKRARAIFAMTRRLSDELCKRI